MAHKKPPKKKATHKMPNGTVMSGSSHALPSRGGRAATNAKKKPK